MTGRVLVNGEPVRYSRPSGVAWRTASSWWVHTAGYDFLGTLVKYGSCWTTTDYKNRPLGTFTTKERAAQELAEVFPFAASVEVRR